MDKKTDINLINEIVKNCKYPNSSYYLGFGPDMVAIRKKHGLSQEDLFDRAIKVCDYASENLDDDGDDAAKAFMSTQSEKLKFIKPHFLKDKTQKITYPGVKRKKVTLEDYFLETYCDFVTKTDDFSTLARKICFWLYQECQNIIFY